MDRGVRTVRSWTYLPRPRGGRRIATRRPQQMDIRAEPGLKCQTFSHPALRMGSPDGEGVRAQGWVHSRPPDHLSHAPILTFTSCLPPFRCPSSQRPAHSRPARSPRPPAAVHPLFIHFIFLFTHQSIYPPSLTPSPACPSTHLPPIRPSSIVQPSIIRPSSVHPSIQRSTHHPSICPSFH